MTTNTVEIAHQTALPQGYTMRPATLEDAEVVAELFNRYEGKYVGEYHLDADDLRVEWQEPKFNLAESARIVESPAGEFVGFVDVWDTVDPPVRIWVWPTVDPEHAGKGLRSALLDWAEARARHALDRAPDGARVIAITGAPAADESAGEVLEGLGYEYVRSFYTMAIEFDGLPEEPVWPEGVTVSALKRGVDERAALRLIHEAFRDHWGHVDTPFEEYLERRMHFIENSPDFNPGLWFLARDGDEVVGASLCWPRSEMDPQKGHIAQLGVSREYRRRGLGLALLLHSFGAFYGLGKSGADLGVDAKNITGALKLYERAGMHIHAQYNAYEIELRPGKSLETHGNDE